MTRPGFVVALWLGSATALAGPPAPTSPHPVVRTRVTVPGGFYTNIDPGALKAMLAAKDFAFINVHVLDEGEIGQTDAHVPYDQVGQKIDQFPSDRTARLVLYCRTGHMSVAAAETLV